MTLKDISKNLEDFFKNTFQYDANSYNPAALFQHPTESLGGSKQFQALPTINLPKQVQNIPVAGGAAQFATNLPGYYINSLANIPVGIGADFGRLASARINNQPSPQYNQLQSPISKLGYQVRGAITPRDVQGYGVNTRPQEVLGNVGAVGVQALNTLLTPGAKNTVTGIVRPQAKNLTTAILKGFLKAAPVGLAYGGATGLDTNRTAASVKDQLIAATKQALIGGTISGAIGGTAAGVSYATSYHPYFTKEEEAALKEMDKGKTLKELLQSGEYDPGTIQTLSQRSRGLGVLADLDNATHTKDKAAIAKAVYMIKNAPDDSPLAAYKGSVDSYLPTSSSDYHKGSTALQSGRLSNPLEAYTQSVAQNGKGAQAGFLDPNAKLGQDSPTIQDLVQTQNELKFQQQTTQSILDNYDAYKAQDPNLPPKETLQMFLDYSNAAIKVYQRKIIQAPPSAAIIPEPVPSLPSWKRAGFPQASPRNTGVFNTVSDMPAVSGPLPAASSPSDPNDLLSLQSWQDAMDRLDPELAKVIPHKLLPKNLMEELRNEQGFLDPNAQIGNPFASPPTPAQPSDFARAFQEGNINLEEAQALGYQPNAVDKVIGALKGAQPIRNQQEALYSAERSKRAAQVAAMGEKVPGEQGYFAQLGQLKGELPKAQFEGIRKQIGQEDVDSLFNQVESSSLSPYEKVTAKNGLAKLLGAQGGQVPNNSELGLLNTIFPPEFTQTVLDKRPLTEKLFSGGAEALNLPREVMATADMSAPLRQGVFLIGRPKQWIPAFKEMVKSFASEDSYQNLQDDIQSRPTYQIMRENNLALTEISSPDLSGREEAFMSSLGEKIPGFGILARASNRAYTGFLNKLRADTFDDLYKNAAEQGLTNDNPKLVADIARFVNSATGRGELGALQKAAPVLNAAFFSPRLMASRLNLLNPAYYVSLEPYVRKEAIKSLLTFAGTGLTIATLAKLGGAQVSNDPRNADFGKIKIGNTRYDPWGGFQQYFVLASRLLTGQMVSSTTGKEFTLGEGGYKPTTRADIIMRFLQSKEAPIASFITGLLQGQTATGEKFNLPAEVADRFIPMVWQDMYDLYKERGLAGIPMATPGIFGTGVQTYMDQIPMQGKTPTGKASIQWRQPPSLGEDILNKMTGSSVSTIPQNQWGPLQQQRKADQLKKIDEDKAKSIVLQTGETQTVGDKQFYLDNGIVKTKSLKPKVTKPRTLKGKKPAKVSVKTTRISPAKITIRKGKPKRGTFKLAKAPTFKLTKPKKITLKTSSGKYPAIKLKGYRNVLTA